MEYDVQRKEISACLLAVVRRRAQLKDLAKVVPEACGIVWGVIREQKIEGCGRNVALYLDDEINLEVGVEVNAPFEGCGEVVGSATPAGTVATVVHYGPYDQLYRAHNAVREWCAHRNYHLSGPNWEIYGHWTEAWNHNPAEIRTDVFYLLDGGS